MKVLTESDGMVTNHEVFSLLTTNKGVTDQSPELKVFKTMALRYLENSPASKETPEGIKECLQMLSRFDLTKAEKIQLVNLLPQHVVDVHLIVDHCPDRLGDENVIAILRELNHLLCPLVPLPDHLLNEAEMEDRIREREKNADLQGEGEANNEAQQDEI